MSRYNEVREAFETLEKLAELDDCVEIDAQMFELLERPTKAHAADIYRSAIEMWFGEHGILPGSEEIAKTYGGIGITENHAKALRGLRITVPHIER